MNWAARTPWSDARLGGVGALSGLLLLVVCIAEPRLRGAAEAAPEPEASSISLPAASDRPPADLLFPVPAVSRASMANSFTDARGERVHHAVDIMAARHSEVVAAASGRIAKVIWSGAGGNSVYQWSADKRFVYYYAHLEAYAPGLVEGDHVERGQLLGYVGTTGNATPDRPHLHFAISRTKTRDQWWGGAPINPYSIWR